MGIGRREFMRLAALASAGLAVNPLEAVVTTSNVYINKNLGILFNKPLSWHFVHVRDFGKLKDQQILGNGWDDEKDEVWKELGEPICIVTKYPQDMPGTKGIFSPTVTLQVTHESELTGIGYSTFDELIELSMEGAAQLLGEFAVVKTYEPYTISNCEVREFDAQYLFEHVDIPEPLWVELKALKAYHNGFYYDFNLHQSAAQGQTAGEEFDALIKSIRFL